MNRLRLFYQVSTLGLMTFLVVISVILIAGNSLFGVVVGSLSIGAGFLCAETDAVAFRDEKQETK